MELSLPTPEDCARCVDLGQCKRHPQCHKVGRLLDICRGTAEGMSDETRVKYVRMWDYVASNPDSSVTDPPRRPVPHNVHPAGCTKRGDFIGICSG